MPRSMWHSLNCAVAHIKNLCTGGEGCGALQLLFLPRSVCRSFNCPVAHLEKLCTGGEGCGALQPLFLRRSMCRSFNCPVVHLKKICVTGGDCSITHPPHPNFRQRSQIRHYTAPFFQCQPGDAVECRDIWWAAPCF